MYMFLFADAATLFFVTVCILLYYTSDLHRGNLSLIFWVVFCIFFVVINLIFSCSWLLVPCTQQLSPPLFLDSSTHIPVVCQTLLKFCWTDQYHTILAELYRWNLNWVAPSIRTCTMCINGVRIQG
jgi:hypothetical protein